MEKANTSSSVAGFIPNPKLKLLDGNFRSQCVLQEPCLRWCLGLRLFRSDDTHRNVSLAKRHGRAQTGGPPRQT